MAKLYCAWAMLCLLLACGHKPNFQAGDSLPSFSMLTLDSSLYNSDQIAKGKYTVILYFRTDCPHCQLETAEIVKNIKALSNINLLFLTWQPLKDLRPYAAFFHLKGENIRVASDYKQQFLKRYKPENVPFSMVFNRDKELRCVYSGPIPVDSLTVLNRSL